MPQIWMTYDEIASLVGCSAEDARAEAVGRTLDRKRSGDGHTRVKLDLLWTALFFARIRETDGDLDRTIDQLKHTHGEMARPRRTARTA